MPVGISRQQAAAQFQRRGTQMLGERPACFGQLARNCSIIGQDTAIDGETGGNECAPEQSGADVVERKQAAKDACLIRRRQIMRLMTCRFRDRPHPGRAMKGRAAPLCGQIGLNTAALFRIVQGSRRNDDGHGSRAACSAAT